MKVMLVTVIIALVAIFAAYYYQSPAEKVAYAYARANSVENLDFRLQKEFNDGSFAKFSVIPYNDRYDTAQIYLRNDGGIWEVIAFGTAFPDLETEYPELKGK